MSTSARTSRTCPRCATGRGTADFVSTSVYLASSEGQSGKSAVAVGILDQLSRRVSRVAVFRPVVRTAKADDDHVLDLLLSRLERTADSSAPLTAAEASGVF